MQTQDTTKDGPLPNAGETAKNAGRPRKVYPWSPESPKQDMATDYGNWLDQMQFGSDGSEHPWHYWSTLTFAEERTSRAVRKAVTGHLERIGADRAFWGMESGKVNGRLHAHALLHFRTELSGDHTMPVGVPRAEHIYRDWFKRHGRAHVDRFEKGKGAAHYVSKYVTKRLCDYDFYVHGLN